MKKVFTNLKEPKSDQDVADMLEMISRVLNEIQTNKTTFAEMIRGLEHQLNQIVRPKERNLTIMKGIVFNYLEKEKERLLNSEVGKTVYFDTGNAFWKFDPPSLSFPSEEMLIRRLEKRGLQQFIETKIVRTIKRKELLEYMKENNVKIRGVHILHNEELYLRPNNIPEKLIIKRSDIPQLEFVFVADMDSNAQY